MATAAQAVVQQCELCDAEVEEMHFCVNCQQYICLECKNYHLRGKKTRRDTVMLLSEAQEQHLVNPQGGFHCVDHIREELSLFCISCDTEICPECLSDNHIGHNVTSLKEQKRSELKQLLVYRNVLTEKKGIYDKAIKTEDNLHMEYIASLQKIITEIGIQKSKIIAELSSICDQQLKEILSFEEKETERHNESSTKLKTQTHDVISALILVQNGLSSKSPPVVAQAVKNAAKVLHGLEDYKEPELKAPTFTRGNVDRGAIIKALGSIQRGGKTIFKGSKFDATNVELLRTIVVKGIARVIKVIVPMEDDEMWVASTLDKSLTLINNYGKYIKRSVKVVKSWIEDAKEFDNEILVTSTTGHKVMKLSGNGKICSVFANLFPYKTRGLCVTEDLNVLVCVESTKDKDGKIVKLGKSGEIILTLNNDKNGAPLFGDLYRITSLSTGEIVITECKAGKIICIDKDGRHKFTWTADIVTCIEEIEDVPEHPFHVANDKNGHLFVTYCDRNKVYVVAKDGSDAKRVDNLELEDPIGIAVNNDGKLLIGCRGGKIHIVQY